MGASITVRTAAGQFCFLPATALAYILVDETGDGRGLPIDPGTVVSIDLAGRQVAIQAGEDQWGNRLQRTVSLVAAAATLEYAAQLARDLEAWQQATAAAANVREQLLALSDEYRGGLVNLLAPFEWPPVVAPPAAPAPR